MRATLREVLAAILVVAALVLILVPQAEAARYAFGCCIPEQGSCIPGDSPPFVSEQAFIDACADAQQKSPPDISVGSVCQTSCELGCCCASPQVPGSAEINNSESSLRTDRIACTRQSTSAYPYTFVSLTAQPAGTTCVQLCGGGAGQQTPTDFAVKGVVRKAGAPAAATLRFFAPGVQESTTTNGLGQYEKQLPSNKEYTVTVEPVDPVCRPQSVSLLLDRTVIKDFTLDCTPRTGCTNQPPVVSNITLISGTANAEFDITYDDRCSNFDSFVIFLCPRGANCAPDSSTTLTRASVTLDARHPYYDVYVRAYTRPTGMVDSAKQRITLGDVECMQERTGNWCGTTGTGQEAILSCDDRNKLVVTACTATQVCTMATTRGAQCTERVDCKKCNGLFGLFASADIPLISNALGPAPLCSRSEQCYLEQTFVPAYRECLGVSACANYTSSASCGADRCDIGSCEWREGNEELGMGVCASTDPAVSPPCRQCESAFGYCNRQLCEGISSQCYYDGITERATSNGWVPQGCIPKSEMACRFYDTAADCGNARFDITYSGAARAGGTNARTASNDKLGFGSCTWIQGENICVKNADNYMIGNEDDCIEAGFEDEELFACLRDVTPPVTAFVLKTPPVYGHAEITSLPFRATDDKTPSENIQTYVCLNTSTSPCYPNTRVAQLNVPNRDADYKIYYYSIDRHFNSEVVKSITVMVRKDNVTTLSNVTIEENS